VRLLFAWFESLLNPYPEALAEPAPARFWPFLWRATRGSRRLFFGMTLCTAVIGVFEAMLFSMLGGVVDMISMAQPAELWERQKWALLTMALILGLSPLVVALQTMLKHQALAPNFPMLMRWNYHRHMLSQSMSFYQDEFAGRVSTKVMQTALAVRDTWFILCDILVFVGIYFFTMVAVVGHFDLWLLLPFLGWVLFYALAVLYFVPRLANMGRAQADARSLMTGRITDAYTNIATVKLFSYAHREAAYARGAMQEFMKTAYGQMRLVSGFEIVNHLLSVALIGGTVTVALSLWMKGDIGPGAVAASTAMALRLNGISHWVMWEFSSLFEHVGTVQDGMQTLSQPVRINDAPQAKPLRVTAGEVHFQNLHFAYPNGQKVFDGLELRIRAGEKIGLVGRSGAGKSTLTHLLLRFDDPQQGRVLIDGQDIASVTQDSLRAQIGVVTQDTSLLHRSVRENVLYGRPHADDDEVLRALERAHADEFVQMLSDPAGRRGLDAHVGERGVKLSGGQRQRVAIARVMLKDAPILLLDEATSALDSEVEAAIQESLYRLMEGKTVLAIAHRLSTIAAMDRLIVLDRGRIVEEGDHASLLAHGGLYAKLWAHQSGGFLAVDVQD
jgi:ATP-binding cassette subfamily B multidrug efflux pump